MGRLDDITIDDLHQLLGKTEGETPIRRILVAVGRKQGDNLDRLAERHNISEKTVRNWLDRFADQPLEEAPYDEHRPGRPSKLTESEREELFRDFKTTPTELGYDRQAWTTKLATHHIETTYGVDYTPRHTRYLMKQAGLSWRTARPRHSDADPEAEAEFVATVQKNDRN